MKCPRSLWTAWCAAAQAEARGSSTSNEQPHRQHKRKSRAGEEREKGRKGQRGRGQEGTEKEEREAEEGGGELVEKDVTGWTEVTRNKRKKMVQIFVKVDGMKTVTMEVSPEDKVQKILNTVSGSDRDVYVTSGGRTLRGSDKLKSCEIRDGEHSGGHEQDARRRKTQGQEEQVWRRNKP